MSDAIAFDPDKDAENRRKHGIGLDRWPRFDAAPIVIEDTRFDYGERRYRAIGRVDGQGMAAVFTVRADTIRLISLRRAREKEMRRYGQ
jgi:uncharacterized protein